MAHAGLALALSMSAWVNASLLFCILVVRKSYRPQRGWLWFILRVAIAVCVMGGCIVMLNSAPDVWFERTFWQRVFALTWLIGAAMTSYFVALLVLGIRPKQLLLSPQHVD